MPTLWAWSNFGEKIQLASYVNALKAFSANEYSTDNVLFYQLAWAIIAQSEEASMGVDIDKIMRRTLHTDTVVAN
jgi:hypothetical protein